MEADIVADPDAVVVEFISTSITSLAMLCVHKHVCIAQITVETIIVLVEVYQGHLVFLSCACKTFKSYCRVRRVAHRRLHSGYNHHKIADEVER